MSEEDDAAPPRNNRRAAAMGGAVGLVAVLAIFGVTRMVAGHGHASADAHPASTALPATVADLPAGAAATGTPVVNVPLYGPTPASTTEPVPAPSALASAAPSAAPASDATPPDSDDDGPSTAGGPILKEWGQGTVGQHPVVLKIKMDGAIERISGASGAAGFTITVPGHRSVSSATELARKDKRLSSVNVVNTSRGSEVTVQFKDGVPPYLAKVKGDKLEIAIGKEGHSKVAKKKKKKAKSDE
jgi:hypothetical protein